jgi:lipopolysaccharide/colanic/teichoic acid biosynthesis glycosyltransferase
MSDFPYARPVFGKRSFDLCVASVATIALSPLLVSIAVAVCVDSPGPVIYRGTRVGLCGREFDILKFRTMTHQPSRVGQLTTALNDPRVTSVGRFLRRYKLDELPQLVNVIRGDMSIVGPRPEHPGWTAKYSHEEQAILSVRPGLTDYASLEFVDLATAVGSEDADQRYFTEVFPRKNELRLQYVATMSWSNDVGLIARTALSLTLRRRAVRHPQSKYPKGCDAL